MFVCPIIGGEGLLSRFFFPSPPCKKYHGLAGRGWSLALLSPPPPPHRPANTSFSGMIFVDSSRLVALVTRIPRRRGSSSGWVLSGSQKPKRIFAGREKKQEQIKKALQADEKSQPTKNNNLTPKPLNPEASHPRVRTHSASLARAAWCNKPRPWRSKASELYKDIEYCGSGFMKQRLGANT